MHCIDAVFTGQGDTDVGFFRSREAAYMFREHVWAFASPQLFEKLCRSSGRAVKQPRRGSEGVPIGVLRWVRSGSDGAPTRGTWGSSEGALKVF